ncbi:DUF4192 family protein [Cryptosporangium aurantiacum]|uniref:DUF4192 domain-containing protein n=1 Tax=Cryptosporangium aurantiacum TaxID=134849 RepID=A0A1M7IYC7_9ACTN|nr:DUF4192 family protein [Cryptosporangium aurantiacum]SHM45834.1 protein of unknown function [Cryptosporangium aurantiacum]
MTMFETPPDRPVVRLSTPPEIVRAIPQLLGFHPTASLVVLGLGGPRRRLRMTLRIDLPAPGGETEIANQVASRLAAEHAAACVVVLFTASSDAERRAPAGAATEGAAAEQAATGGSATEGSATEGLGAAQAGAGASGVEGSSAGGSGAGGSGAGGLGGGGAASSGAAPSGGRTWLPGATMAFAVERALTLRGVEVRELLRAESGRWWSYACERPCCPPDGLPLGSGPTTLLEVLRVAAGRPLFPDRSALITSVERAPGEPTEALREALQARMDAVIREAPATQAVRDLAAIQGILTATTAAPPGGAEVPPGGAADPPGGPATVPGGVAAPLKGAADPLKDAAVRPGDVAAGPRGAKVPSEGVGVPPEDAEATPGGAEATPGGAEATPGGAEATPGGAEATSGGAARPGDSAAGSQAGPSDGYAAGATWGGLAGDGPDDGAVGSAYDDRTVAMVAIALTNLTVRDSSFAWTGGPYADAAATLWRELVRRVPPPYAAAPATLLAVSAYRRGDGALADVYLRRALDDDPDYRMADLVLTSLENGFRPSQVECALGLGGSRHPAEPASQPTRREGGRRGRRKSAPRRDGGTDAE